MKAYTSEYLQSIIDGIPDPVVVIDRDYTISFMNQAASISADYSPPSGDRRSCHLLLHGRNTPCDAHAEPCPLREVLETGKPVRLYHRHGGEGAKSGIIEISASPLRGDHGECVGIVEILRRIDDGELASRLKTADSELWQSREALMKEHTELSRVFKLVELGKREWEKTMDCVEDMVILTDTRGLIKRCNKSFKEFMGRTYDQLLGRECVKLLNDRGMEVKEFSPKETEVFFRPAERWFRVATYPVRVGEGDQASGTTVTIHDITDIKRMTRKLERTNREIEENRLGLQRALDELSSLIRQVEKEQAFNIRFKNPNLVKCYERKRCGMEDCPCYGKDAARCWQIAGTHCGGAAEGAFALKFENCIECEVFQAAAPNSFFLIGEHFNNMMNILELKNKELEQAYSELKLTQTKILQQEKMASIGLLAAGVAHEINNPMGFISSNLATLRKYLERIFEYMRAVTDALSVVDQVAADDRLTETRKRLKIDLVAEDARKLIAESLDGAERVTTIVQNLKSFSRVDQAESKLADINECIETTLNIVWSELKYKATVNKLFGALPLVRCYPQQLNQVFMNLLVNAGQAMEKGTITIRTWAEAGSIFAAVSDTGMGIPEKDLSRIFEPFFTTKEVGKGTGLGLSITYDIVKKHNGDITVQSEVGKGATFTVRIPLVEAANVQ